MSIYFKNPQDAALLREAFLSAAYNVQTLQRHMRWDSIAPSMATHAPALLDALEGDTKLCGLLKLFLFEYAVDRREAAEAVHPASLEALLEAGVLKSADGIEACVRVVPLDRLLIVSDRRYIGSELPRDMVMGAGLSSSVLMRGTIRNPSSRTLDLCAGSGVQSLAAAAHSESVLALEKNSHAIELGRFAAVLNGLDNIEFRESDFYSAAEGERFDLIVANPPYVISPESEFQFRDGGLGADRVSEHVARNGARFLNEGGYLQMVCDWANYRGRDWQDRLAEWAGDSGCDMLVLRGRGMTAAEYPGIWIAGMYSQAPAVYLQKARRWLDYYREQEIESMNFGFITLRKRSGPRNWFHATDAPLESLSVSGEYIERKFQAQDFLEANAADDVLLEQYLTLEEAVRFDQRYVPGGEAWNLDECALAMADASMPPVKTDRYMAGLCGRLRGERPLGVVLAEMAGAMNTSLDKLVPQVTPILRGLIERGYLGWKTGSR
jgi:methylase of polypeptide subunit release factors